MELYNFEKLDVYKKSLDFIDFVYSILNYSLKKKNTIFQVNYVELLLQLLWILQKEQERIRKFLIDMLGFHKEALVSAWFVSKLLWKENIFLMKNI